MYRPVFSHFRASSGRLRCHTGQRQSARPIHRPLCRTQYVCTGARGVRQSSTGIARATTWMASGMSLSLMRTRKGLAHYNPDRIGADASLAPYGDELTSATAEGKWFSHMNVNPETGTEQLKHFWIILYDGLTFASGWYEE